MRRDRHVQLDFDEFQVFYYYLLSPYSENHNEKILCSLVVLNRTSWDIAYQIAAQVSAQQQQQMHKMII